MLIQFPLVVSMLGCDGPTGSSNQVDSQNQEFVKDYIYTSTGPREHFDSRKAYKKPDLSEIPDQIGETEWPAEALAKSAAFTPYVHNVSVTTTTVCPALQGRITVDLNQGAGGKYIYICWGQDDGIKDNSVVPGGTDIAQLESGLSSNNVAAGNTGGYWYRNISGGKIIGRFVNPVNYSNGDMNQGTGSRAYIWVMKVFTNNNFQAPTNSNPTGAERNYRLRGLNVVAGGSAVACPTGYAKVRNWTDGNGQVDMNNSAGGAYVYICQLYY